MTTHTPTPGPWIHHNAMIAFPGDGERLGFPIATVEWGTWCGIHESAANARVLAASWDLLRALKGARLFVYAQMGVAEKQGWPTDHFRNEIAEYDAAIAKAEGGQ